jgi:hypothetical protein
LFGLLTSVLLLSLLRTADIIYIHFFGVQNNENIQAVAKMVTKQIVQEK